MHKIEQIHKTHKFSPRNHKGENLEKFLRIVQSQSLYHKMNKPNNNRSSTIIYLSSLSFSLSLM